MDRLLGLSHLLVTYFLFYFSGFIVLPGITDVTMSAVCPGEDECSIAIYLSGIQQVLVGLGTLVMAPLIGNLSDKYGRKALLTVPMTLTILPVAILAYKKTTYYFYAYYVLKTIMSMICEGSVHSLALTYAADTVSNNRRASAFGIVTGISSIASIAGTLCARFISTSSAFQGATVAGMLGLVYMRVFLKESIPNDDVSDLEARKGQTKINGLEEAKSKVRVFRTLPSLDDLVSMLTSSLTFSQIAIVAMLIGVGDNGISTSLTYYLKSIFSFDKNQFAELLLITGIGATISQMILMPILVPTIGEKKLLSIGLFFTFAYMFLDSIAWSSWVPYAAAMSSVMAVFAMPTVLSIASKQVGSYEQEKNLPDKHLNHTERHYYTWLLIALLFLPGKAQGCISGLVSFSSILSPLVFSPLTALFLSENAPFDFPGFSLACAAFTVLVAFGLSIMIRAAPPISNSKSSNNCMNAEF